MLSGLLRLLRKVVYWLFIFSKVQNSLTRQIFVAKQIANYQAGLLQLENKTSIQLEVIKGLYSAETYLYKSCIYLSVWSIWN